MSEERKTLEEFANMGAGLTREQKLIVVGIMKGMQIESLINKPNLQPTGT